MKKYFWNGFITGMAAAVITMCLGVSGYNFWQYRLANQQNIANQDTQTKEAGTEKEISAVELLTKITVLEKYIGAYYLNEVNVENLADGIYKGVVAGLGDPYSVFYTQEEYASLQESTSGIYCGIGVRVSQDMSTGIISVITPFEGSPANEAGILPEDILYKVEGEMVTGEDLSEVVAKMKGEEGTKVNLTIMRDNSEIEMDVMRKTIENPTVEHSMLENKIGYIKVSEFDEVTAQQFKTALDDMEKQGMESLIIDLRNNGGGRLTAVVEMLDRMLPEGVVLTTKEKSGEGETFKSTNKETFEKPLVVMINEKSASASEVFAGAIQDYKTGKLLGTTSFGKGIVQTIFPLGDGTAVKLTTSEYFTPQGRNIHGSGLKPDIEVVLNEELKKKVKIEVEEDNQLQAAILQLEKE